MASTRYVSLVVLVVLLAIVVLCVLPGSCTSRCAFATQKVKQNGFRITLKHIDAGKNLTKFQRIQQGMKRGQHRLQRLNAVSLAASGDDHSSIVTAPLHAGNGEFLMDLAIGSPPSAYSAIVDTGSDLIWTQCKPCKQCFDQPTPVFDPKKSSSFSKLSCSSDLCEALPQSTCGKEGCEYLYTYGDYSSTQGRMASETFTFGVGKSSDEKVSVPGIVFGCGGDNQGDGFTQGSGLVGLGRGPLSLVSQLKQPKFSYCLTSIEDDSKTSKLLMGSLASVNTSSSNDIMTTPLIKNPSQSSFYYLNLEGISIGGTRLPIKKSSFSLQDDGTGGLIIDSGTTITYLEQSAFDLVKDEFSSQMKLSLDDSGSGGLDLCFKLPEGAKKVEVPKFVFHFKGSDLELPGENYMIGDSSMGLLCLAMGASSGMSILGNVQQQNMLVVHDLEQETLSFVPTQCDQL